MMMIMSNTTLIYEDIKSNGSTLHRQHYHPACTCTARINLHYQSLLLPTWVSILVDVFISVYYNYQHNNYWSSYQIYLAWSQTVKLELLAQLQLQFEMDQYHNQL